MSASPERMLREFHASKAIHAGLMPKKPTADIPDWVRDLRMALLSEEVRELYDAAMRGDLVKIADGIADIAYVVVGTAVAYGIPFDAVFTEVHRSNMTKVNTPAEAKLVKGPDYEPPDIARVLDTPQQPEPAHTFTRDQLVDALTRLDIKVLVSGPAAGMINAESMADALIEALNT